jgi:hypothetical protein
MPIWLRKFTYNEINEFYVNEKEQIEEAQGKKKVTSQTKTEDIKKISQSIKVPDFVSKMPSRKK